ncbi:unnamed protein product [Owenia fusiformis]|uniref:Apple domain-containing protein n=2 Tax=Owenia fusiformis TaxID=6347 RepID=A0A8S4P330_OWEFU|nr:unnamed protein product [Owenia fusiformis]
MNKMKTIFCIFVCITAFNASVYASSVKVLRVPDANNVYDRVDPMTSKGSVHYLGTFNTTEECEKECIKQAERCWSYTYYSLKFTGYNGQCFGRMEDLQWSPMKQEDIDSGRILWPCRSNMDCSLNGECLDGMCKCDPAWMLHNCDVLNLLPANKNTGYKQMDDGAPTSSWGGPVVRDPVDGTYHMFPAEMTRHCGINSWIVNSRIVHAMSETPTGKYKRIEEQQPPFAHEPDVINGPRGEAIMYWSAMKHKNNDTLCNCSDGSTPPSCQPGVITFTTYMSMAPRPRGPWSKPVVIFPTAPGDNNLAMVILKNGTLVGFSRTWGPRGSRIHLLRAESYLDPSTYKQNPEELWPFLPAPGTEDPFVYIDKRGNFHAIFHNKYPSNVQESVGGHAFSPDGINWQYGGRAFGNKVQFTDGTEFEFTRRERPHFVFDKDGVTPLALTSGAQYGGKYNDACYTLLQPVNH